MEPAMPLPSRLLLLGCLFSLALPPRVWAEKPDRFREGLQTAATQIEKALKDRKVTEVARPQVKGPRTTPEGGGGQEIVRILIEELEKRKITIKEVATAGIEIRYRPIKVQEKGVELDRGGLRLQIIVEVGGVEKELAPIDIAPGVERTIHVLGLQGTLDGKDKTTVQVEQQVLRRLSEPEVGVDEKNFVLPRKGHPYGVAVLVKGKAVKPTIRDKLPFIKLELGADYTLLLKNDTNREAAALVTIDGVSAFANSVKDTTGKPKYAHFIIPAKKQVEIKGWHIKENNWRTFRVGKYEDSVGAKLRSGVRQAITVSFVQAWKKGEPAPANEPNPVRAAAGADGYGTALGDPIKADTTEVMRNVGKAPVAVTIRYDVSKK